MSAKEANTPGFQEAKKAESDQWRRKKVIDTAEDKGYSLIDTSWVYTQKVIASGKVKEKARLVARGFQDSREGLEESYSPTCSTTGLRLLLALCAVQGWVPAVIDVTTAFLQGKPIGREVYLKPPKEALEQLMQVWRLNVTLSLRAPAQHLESSVPSWDHHLHLGQPLQGSPIK